MPMEAEKERFLEVLAAQGGRAGNDTMRRLLGWPAETYEAVRQMLLDEGRIEKGRGRGGSVRLVQTATDRARPCSSTPAAWAGL